MLRPAPRPSPGASPTTAADTDADGLLDIQEHYNATTPANYPSGTVGADSLIATPDFAGLLDVYFQHGSTPAYNVIRFTAGADWVEQPIRTRNASDLIDSDGDGLSDADEVASGSNPDLWDTEGMACATAGTLPR